jgi:uroporphyrinogen decarboxylase
MTPKQTIINAFEGKRTERVPVTIFGAGMWSIHTWGASFEALSTDRAKMVQMLVEMSEKLQCDIVYVGSGYNNFHAAALGGRIKFRPMGAPDLEEHLINSDEDLSKLNIADLDGNAVINNVKAALRETRKKIGEEFVVTMTAWGPFTLGARLIGEEAMMKATFKKPALVDKIIDFATSLLIHLYAPVVEDGTLEVISIADPTASGDLISRKQFERFAVPYLKKFTDWARSHKVHTLLHICGNTTDRLDLFPMTGASCISLDHKTDIARAKEVLHGKMCFGGNVNPVQVLLQGTPELVSETCRHILEAAAKDGGFVLMPGCDIPPTVPYENIQAMMKTAHDYKY